MASSSKLFGQPKQSPTTAPGSLRRAHFPKRALVSISKLYTEPSMEPDSYRVAAMSCGEKLGSEDLPSNIRLQCSCNKRPPRCSLASARKLLAFSFLSVWRQ